jgi:FKBP-type peptidyl-prolyl cis-trans isomerase
MKMSLGEKAILRITSDYGYGAAGAGGVIPPNADLVFEVAEQENDSERIWG